jgi:hypothetical protein
MKRSKALTVYIIFPCLLYGVALLTLLAISPEIVTTIQLRVFHTIFAIVIIILIHTKKDKLLVEK